MKEKISEIKSIWIKYELGYYFSLSGSLLLGIINLVNTINSFSWLYLNYSLVPFIFALIKVIIRKVNDNKKVLITGLISLFFVSIPLVVSMVLTILERDKPNYMFFWIIYAYALYAVIKISTSIKKAIKKDKTNCELVLSYLGLISSLFTIELLEFALISTFGEGDKLLVIQLLYQGFVVVFIAFCVVKLVIKVRDEYINV